MTTAPHPRPVLAGVDASEAALRAVAFAADEARRREAPLHLVHALARPAGGSGDVTACREVEALVRAAGQEILDVAARGVEGVARVVTCLAERDPVQALRKASATAQ
ncbi:universal stress protein, partial [Blastococcus sp. KM273128]|uniref:universal stress protein n=1 Tax=Blastococcus sp. KM273128 TaxID=2570314 RepID=UPI001F3E9D52